MHESIAAGNAATAGRDFWRRHLLAPLCCFAPLAALFALTDLDRQISRAWAYDAASGGFPARHAFWAERLLHADGRDLVWLVVLGSAAVLAASALRPGWRVARRPALYVILAIGLATALIGGLKEITQVHCPWELQGFGGTALYSTLFGARVTQLTPGQCFPGAHSGSGFALFALYFALRNYDARWARRGLLAALLVGCSFAFAQEARGAHFVSHDLWSAMIAWCMSLGLYARVLAPATSPRPAPVAQPPIMQALQGSND
jgi:membrane-associated PAP2 superfamily phosphatase